MSNSENRRLTEQVKVRLLPHEKSALEAEAALRGVTVPRLLRLISVGPDIGEPTSEMSTALDCDRPHPVMRIGPWSDSGDE
ncbi:Uncharacterised protein [Mycobacteroides abscessus subsp. abscessus]|uniref:Uncharacterized protein n=1 Tax=Mycobacteroides abscessus TaxID=36809 RepID=A0AB33T1X1_9MYCO|nr:hypothetical protein [Mycobacteroides abscessus]EIC71235.1 hypothetical protein S7W_00420 [Mycobacteroides abscessus M94]MBE5449642.1 hypothetical protein [Mycobacteroides abscessus]MBE5463971.1 hypothetical protein [Mycobacteroides abscessus]MBN7531526.1 hypothetical protein [Mycobacteroides abscessus subsp. abscessus]MDB2195067.1 hypothetical protein [Mycobacteroides abscessus subsp. abscessus]